jgi:hypothetical protein
MLHVNDFSLFVIILYVIVTKNLKFGNVETFYCQQLMISYHIYQEHLHVTQWKVHSLVSLLMFHQPNDVTIISIQKLKVFVNAGYMYCPVGLPYVWD